MEEIKIIEESKNIHDGFLRLIASIKDSKEESTLITLVALFKTYPNYMESFIRALSFSQRLATFSEDMLVEEIRKVAKTIKKLKSNN